MAHSWEYGFILRYPNDKTSVTGTIYEPWHYRYVGTELAKELFDAGLTLEEYLQNLTQ
jgi:D-alanyl-D-alanine carboxypeptidase